MAKFRNLLVHQYGKVEDLIVYGILKNDTGDILKYIEEIKSFSPTQITYLPAVIKSGMVLEFW
jgi:uncharacterized protein YutE (UPF0331/DUF86 family)